MNSLTRRAQGLVRRAGPPSAHEVIDTLVSAADSLERRVEANPVTELEDWLVSVGGVGRHFGTVVDEVFEELGYSWPASGFSRFNRSINWDGARMRGFTVLEELDEQETYQLCFSLTFYPHRRNDVFYVYPPELYARQPVVGKVLKTFYESASLLAGKKPVHRFEQELYDLVGPVVNAPERTLDVIGGENDLHVHQGRVMYTKRNMFRERPCKGPIESVGVLLGSAVYQDARPKAYTFFKPEHLREQLLLPE